MVRSPIFYKAGEGDLKDRWERRYSGPKTSFSSYGRTYGSWSAGQLFPSNLLTLIQKLFMDKTEDA